MNDNTTQKEQSVCSIKQKITRKNPVYTTTLGNSTADDAIEMPTNSVSHAQNFQFSVRFGPFDWFAAHTQISAVPFTTLTTSILFTIFFFFFCFTPLITSERSKFAKKILFSR